MLISPSAILMMTRDFRWCGRVREGNLFNQEVATLNLPLGFTVSPREHRHYFYFPPFRLRLNPISIANMSRPFSNQVTLAPKLTDETRKKLLEGILQLQTWIDHLDPDPAAVGPSLEPSYTLDLAQFLGEAAKITDEARRLRLVAWLEVNWDLDVVRTCDGDSGDGDVVGSQFSRTAFGRTMKHTLGYDDGRKLIFHTTLIGPIDR